MIKYIKKLLIYSLLTTFLGMGFALPQAEAKGMPWMPMPGVRISLSPPHTPAYLKGLVIHPDNAFKFDFLVYKGDKPFNETEKKDEYQQLIKYFMASLTIPDEEQWVNLSPYEKNRIIEKSFSQTEMGRDLLAQDYLLKQITSSLMYPEEKIGKEFWDRVYTRARQELGVTDMPMNTFNKVWITPDYASIYEKDNTVYVVENHLKVMLESDYLALQKNNLTSLVQTPTDPVPAAPYKSSELGKLAPAVYRAPASGPPVAAATTGSLASQVVKDIIIPELEREVNEGKNFAALRQIYSAMILAAWYKRALKESLLGKIYANKGKVKGLEYGDKNTEQIYSQYLVAFKKGVFNYIKEDVDKYTQQPMPRKYFSGGAEHTYFSKLNVSEASRAMASADYAMNATNIDRVETVVKNDEEQSPYQILVERKALVEANIYSYLQHIEILLALEKEYPELNLKINKAKVALLYEYLSEGSVRSALEKEYQTMKSREHYLLGEEIRMIGDKARLRFRDVLASMGIMDYHYISALPHYLVIHLSGQNQANILAIHFSTTNQQSMIRTGTVGVGRWMDYLDTEHKAEEDASEENVQSLRNVLQDMFKNMFRKRDYAMKSDDEAKFKAMMDAWEGSTPEDQDHLKLLFIAVNRNDPGVLDRPLSDFEEVEIDVEFMSHYHSKIDTTYLIIQQAGLTEELEDFFKALFGAFQFRVQRKLRQHGSHLSGTPFVEASLPDLLQIFGIPPPASEIDPQSAVFSEGVENILAERIYLEFFQKKKNAIVIQLMVDVVNSLGPEPTLEPDNFSIEMAERFLSGFLSLDLRSIIKDYTSLKKELIPFIIRERIKIGLDHKEQQDIKRDLEDNLKKVEGADEALGFIGATRDTVMEVFQDLKEGWGPIQYENDPSIEDLQDLTELVNTILSGKAFLAKKLEITAKLKEKNSSLHEVDMLVDDVNRLLRWINSHTSNDSISLSENEANRLFPSADDAIGYAVMLIEDYTKGLELDTDKTIAMHGAADSIYKTFVYKFVSLSEDLAMHSERDKQGLFELNLDQSTRDDIAIEMEQYFSIHKSDKVPLLTIKAIAEDKPYTEVSVQDPLTVEDMKRFLTHFDTFDPNKIFPDETVKKTSIRSLKLIVLYTVAFIMVSKIQKDIEDSAEEVMARLTFVYAKNVTLLDELFYGEGAPFYGEKKNISSLIRYISGLVELQKLPGVNKAQWSDLFYRGRIPHHFKLLSGVLAEDLDKEPQYTVFNVGKSVKPSDMHIEADLEEFITWLSRQKSPVIINAQIATEIFPSAKEKNLDYIRTLLKYLPELVPNDMVDEISIASKDPAMLNPGGIDLNSKNLDLRIKRDGNGVPLPVSQQNMDELMKIDFFEAVIVDIKPITSLPILTELR